MHVEWKTVTGNLQVTRKLKEFAQMCCTCNTSPKLVLRTSVTSMSCLLALPVEVLKDLWIIVCSVNRLLWSSLQFSIVLAPVMWLPKMTCNVSSSTLHRAFSWHVLWQTTVWTDVFIPKCKLRFPGHQISWVSGLVIDYAIFLHGLAQQWGHESNKICYKGSLGDEDDVRTLNTHITQRNRAIPHSMMKSRMSLARGTDQQI